MNLKMPKFGVLVGADRFSVMRELHVYLFTGKKKIVVSRDSLRELHVY